MTVSQLKFQGSSLSKWNWILRVSSCVEQGFTPNSLYLPSDPRRLDTWKEWAGEVKIRRLGSSLVIRMHCPLPRCSVPIPDFCYFMVASFVFHFPDCFVMFMKGFMCIRISCVLHACFVNEGKTTREVCFLYSKSLFERYNNLTESLIQVISVKLLICTIRASTLLLPMLFSIEKTYIVSIHRCFWNG